jgi:transcriptional regulator with XRE-family HTH domain
MATLYETLASLCEERGIKGGRMCTDLGFSKSLMTDLKSGRKKSVNAETAQKLAAYFNVSVGYLLGSQENESKKEQPIVQYDELSKNRKALVEYALSLTEDQAGRAYRILKAIVEGDL